MADWNGRTVFVEADSEGTPDAKPVAAGQFIDARRRHNLVTRINTARERGLLSEAAPAFSDKEVQSAALELLRQMQGGRLTRSHVEMEQRADMDRLAGWRTVAPAVGTPLHQKMVAVDYRMKVRKAALDAFASQELATLTSTTGHNDREVTDPVTRRPWRPGV